MIKKNLNKMKMNHLKTYESYNRKENHLGISNRGDLTDSEKEECKEIKWKRDVLKYGEKEAKRMKEQRIKSQAEWDALSDEEKEERKRSNKQRLRHALNKFKS